MHGVEHTGGCRVKDPMASVPNCQLRFDFLFTQQAVPAATTETEIESSRLPEHVRLESHVGSVGEFMACQPSIFRPVVQNRQATDVFTWQPLRLRSRPHRIDRASDDSWILRGKCS